MRYVSPLYQHYTILFHILPSLLYCTVLYCTVLYCTVLYCTVLYCTVLCFERKTKLCHGMNLWRAKYGLGLKDDQPSPKKLGQLREKNTFRFLDIEQNLLCFGTLNCIVLHCTIVYHTVLYCTALYCTVLYYTVLYCTVLYCTVLYCTVL